jgi:hypothetical protein
MVRNVPIDEVRVLRYPDSPECSVVVDVRGKEMVLRCRDYNQAVKWARIECKSYKLTNEFSVEQVAPHPPRRPPTA